MVEKISGAGNKAEEKCLKLLKAKPMFTEVKRASGKCKPLGDIQFIYKNASHYVEVKQCTSKESKNKTRIGTINQIRPMKFIPLVVWDPSVDSWYVVPASKQIEMALDKLRGQHNELAWECTNISIKQIDAVRCNEDQTAERIARAIDEDSTICKNAKFIFSNLLTKLRSLKKDTDEKIKEVLSNKAVPQ
jgi:hypothetical protein